MPKNKCNDCDLVSTAVKLRQGDLMLCEACNRIRFPPLYQNRSNSSSYAETNPKTVVQSNNEPEKVTYNTDMYQNELLSYVMYYYNCSSVECIKKSVLSFYTPEEINEAKEQLWSTNEGKINCSKHKRNSTPTRAAHEADLADILNVIVDLDRQGDIYLGKYYAINIGRLPKCAPEEFNSFAMIDRMRALEIQLSEVKELALNNNTRLNSNDMKLCDINTKLVDNITETNKIGSQTQSIKVLVDSVKPSYSSMLKSADMDKERTYVKQAVEVNPSVEMPVSENRNISAVNDKQQLNVNNHAPRPQPRHQVHRFKDFGRERLASASSMASSNRDANSEKNFQFPPYYRRKLKKQHIVTGKSSSTRLQGAPLPSRDIFIYRLNSETTEVDINSYLKENNIESRDLVCMSHAESKFKSFKLSVSVKDVNTVFSEDFWPVGIKVRRFRQPTSNVFNDGWNT